jgi:hypothetical protein
LKTAIAMNSANAEAESHSIRSEATIVESRISEGLTS